MMNFIKNLFRKGEPKEGPKTPILDHLFPSNDLEGSNKISLRNLHGMPIFVVSYENYRRLLNQPELLDRIWHSHPLNKEGNDEDEIL